MELLFLDEMISWLFSEIKRISVNEKKVKWKYFLTVVLSQQNVFERMKKSIVDKVLSQLSQSHENQN